MPIPFWASVLGDRSIPGPPRRAPGSDSRFATLTGKWLTESDSVPQARTRQNFANHRKILAYGQIRLADRLTFDFKKPGQAALRNPPSPGLARNAPRRQPRSLMFRVNKTFPWEPE